MVELYAPYSDGLRGLSSGGPLHPAVSICGHAHGGSHIWQPRDPPAASRERERRNQK
ncbi:hypothetical protein SLEP1_g29605 [Rubroshorea leprosula]|uniref:Uncharacterized protein n=1 Tax=Rubroshorea leprosula TaxID=152421 RepID=A0AAV5K4H4_9ROSI|nr:hypothetical protein SLEP1_g29605 [Rubroshorea leprosula]